MPDLKNKPVEILLITMKRITLIISILLTLAFAASAQKVAIGETLNGSSLVDTAGAAVTFDSLKGTNGTLIVFLSIQCPVVRSYKDRLNSLAEGYKAKGINVIGVNANFTETADQIKAHAAANYTFPVLIDKGNILADRLNANSTPEAYFFDAKSKLLYQGAIDNDRTGKNITQAYTKAALDSALAGEAVAKPKTAAFGCTIRRAGD